MLPKFSTYETSHNVKEASYFLQSDLEITTNEGIGASRTIIGDPMLSKINLAIADNLLLVKPTADTPFRITVNALTEAKPRGLEKSPTPGGDVSMVMALITKPIEEISKGDPRSTVTIFSESSDGLSQTPISHIWNNFSEFEKEWNEMCERIGENVNPVIGWDGLFQRIAVAFSKDSGRSPFSKKIILDWTINEGLLRSLSIESERKKADQILLESLENFRKGIAVYFGLRAKHREWVLKPLMDKIKEAQNFTWRWAANGPGAITMTTLSPWLNDTWLLYADYWKSFADPVALNPCIPGQLEITRGFQTDPALSKMLGEFTLQNNISDLNAFIDSLLSSSVDPTLVNELQMGKPGINYGVFTSNRDQLHLGSMATWPHVRIIDTNKMAKGIIHMATTFTDGALKKDRAFERGQITVEEIERATSAIVKGPLAARENIKPFKEPLKDDISANIYKISVE